MKKINLVLLLFFACYFLQAQTDTTTTQNTDKQDDNVQNEKIGTNNISVDREPPGEITPVECISTDISILQFSANGGSNTVGIAAICPWSASDDRSWISIVENYSLNTIEVTCSVNPNSSGRSGTITISSSTNTIQIYVFQDAKTCTPKIYTLNGDSDSWCYGEGSSKTLTLSNSEFGVNYTLKDGSNSISTKSGTGRSLSWNVSPTSIGEHTYSVLAERISPSCNQEMNGTVTINIYALPNTYELMQAGNICEGYDLRLSSSQAGVTYKLRRDGNVIDTRFVDFGQEGNKILFGIHNQPGLYDVEAEGLTMCTSLTNTVEISSPPPPSISSISNKTICENESVGFTVSGTNIENYQWQERSPDGSFINIGNQTNTLSLSNVSISKNGYQYRCIGEGTCESVTSGTATLYVNSATQIHSQSYDKSICEGGVVQFYVAASGTNLQYQWQTDKSGSWTDLGEESGVNGSNTDQLELYNVLEDDQANYRVIVSGECGSNKTSNVISLTVNENTGITNHPSNQTVCEGNSVSFSISANGTSLSYQWQEYNGSSWSNISGATNSSYSISSSPTSKSGHQFRCQVTGTCGSETSNSANLTVNQTTSVDNNPSDKTVCEGSSASFSISASGTSLSFQWQEYNGNSWSNISGATNNSYSISTAPLSKNGYQYRCRVSGSCGTVYSNSADLIVNKNTVISSQPSNETICEEENMAFHLAADGTNIHYQWQKDNGSAWINLSDGDYYRGTTSDQLSILNTTLSHQGDYRCIVTGTCGSETSNTATLTVNQTTSVGNNPSDKTVCEGSSASFSISASGTSLSYQWQEYNGSSWSNIPEASNNSYSISSASTSQDGYLYRCRVSGTCGTVNSSSATLSVNENTGIASQPSDKTVCEGSSASFSISASGTSLSYQWQEYNGSSWSNISGAANSSYSISSASIPQDGYLYRCRVSGTCGTVNSSSATLSVNENTGIVSQPSYKEACEGSNATFSVNAEGSGLSYQWWKDDGNGWSQTGTDQPSYTESNASYSDNDNQYYVVVMGTCGEETSNTASLTVHQITEITNQTLEQEVCEGSDAVFSVETNGPNMYHWQKSPDGIIWEDQTEGVSGNTFTASAVSALLNGYQYRCIANSGCGTDTSNAAELTVFQAPIISNHPIDVITTNQEAVEFQAYAEGAGINYQWEFDNGNGWESIAGESTNQLNIISDYALDGNLYRCHVTGTCGDLYTNTAMLTVYEPVKITSELNSPIGVTGNHVEFSIESQGPVQTYIWEHNRGSGWSQITGAENTNTYITPVNDDMNGDQYRCILNGEYNSDTSSIATLSVLQGNYILEENFTISGVTTDAQADLLSRDEKQASITYFDGLGRATQIIQIEASPSGKDIVKPIVYDDFGRQHKKLLPYTSETGSGLYRQSAEIKQTEFYDGQLTTSDQVAEDPMPWTKILYESSPLNRIARKGGPGETWQPDPQSEADNAIHYTYETNQPDEVKYFKTDGSGNLIIDNHYNSNTLYKHGTRDENGVWSYEYKNLQGQVVMNKTDPGGENTRTYYVYDEFEDLRYVIPPLAVEELEGQTIGQVGQALIDNLCYYYEYDGRRRMVEKKLPGQESVYMIYDKRDRLVLTQDGNLRSTAGSNRWQFTKYDQLNRPIIEGIWHGPLEKDTRMEMQIYLENNMDQFYETNGSATHGYSNNSFPNLQSDDSVLIVNYYDDYDFDDNTITDDGTVYNGYHDWLETKYSETFDIAETHNQVATNLTGLQTGIKQLVLGTDQEQYLTSVLIYDRKYREIGTYNEYFHQDITVNGPACELVLTKYNFPGDPFKSRTIHMRDDYADKIIVDKEYEYDHASRLKRVYHQIEGSSQGKQLISEMDYNELGEQIQKNLHSNGTDQFLQRVDYRYNIRGWLTKINDPEAISDDLFAMSLGYNEDMGLGADVQYNGNISAMKWRNSSETEALSYEFFYDNLNRLSASKHGDNTGGSWQESGAFDVQNIQYDANGNLRSLKRYESSTLIDDLTYTYENTNASNRLQSVVDGGTTDGFNDRNTISVDYLYDANGNLREDRNKNIDQIIYNRLNLPQSVEFADGDKIEYIYDASGNKQVRIVSGSESDLTYYMGTFEYQNGSLSQIFTDEGRIRYDGSNYFYDYYLSDHLGNTRAIFTKSTDGNSELLQANNYYPFGMRFNQSPITQSQDNDYLYNGKELQKFGLDWYDYGARMYDAALGRFHTQDRYAEKYLSMSPYQYAANNPIIFIDVNGDSVNVADLYAKEDGEYVNPSQIKSFEIWASTDAGREYILNHAEEGFELTGVYVEDLEIKAENAGESHEEGIDVSFGTKDLGYAGATNRKISDDNRLKLSFSMDAGSMSASKQSLFEGVETWSHEVFIHGDHHQKKFLGQTPYSDYQNHIHELPFESTQYYNVGIETLQQAQKMLNFDRVNTRGYIYYNIMLPNYNYGKYDPRKDIKY
jgi:RHS repeat-associated protein